MSTGKFRQNFFFRQIHAEPRLFVAALVGIATSLSLPILPYFESVETITRIIIGWNATACLYLLLIAMMAVRATRERVRYRARLQDEGKFIILTLVIIATLASLLAIFAELIAAKNLTGLAKYSHIGLASFTIFSSWAFVHTIFAVHYAHDYFMNSFDGKTPGLEFPGADELEYGDFFYFAFIIGTSAQTADVNFVSSAMRRIGLIHCVLAFFFNTTILALTINISASLI